MAGLVDTTRPAHAGRLGYLPGLDGLRAVSIMTVVALHVGYFGAIGTLAGGFLGVQVFFVISGFLITALLVEERERNGRIRLGMFYMRRGLRLFPALAAAVIVAVVYASIAPHSQFRATAKESLASVFYWDNWYHAFRVGRATILVHTWSLSIEEQFYLLWPLLLIVGLRYAPRALLPVTVVAALAIALARAITDLASSNDFSTQLRLFFGTDMRADALLVGCALALAWDRGWLPRLRPALPWLAPVAVAVLAYLIWHETVPSRSLYVVGLFACAVASAVLIACVVAGRPQTLIRALEVPQIVFVGKISYGLYLWHYIVFWIVRDHTAGWSQGAVIPLELALAVGVAVASYYLLELPIVRKKARFTPRRA
jgi:peptidoglycan/LPS O-acetylase OafA/YrhL